MSGLGQAVTAAVAEAIAQIGPGTYGVACSGGADSLALAHAAIAVAGAANVVVVTIDHGLQPESAEVAGRVAAWAHGQGAAAVIRRVDVAPRASLEAAARAARHAALERLVGELGLACMLVGHTARDQAETVLMRIVRGTGPAGLVGIPRQRGAFLRPLLRVERADVEAYVAAHALPCWDDPMNQDARFARVRMRALLAENPQLPAALVRLAESADEWREVIDALAAPWSRFPLDCATLAPQRAAIRKRAVAMALEAAGLSYDAAHLDALDALVIAPCAGERRLDVPGGRVVRRYDVLDVPRAPAEDVALDVPPGHELRTWRAGDRMRPARLRGHSRKLSDLYIDAKVPRGLRTTARVLVRIADQEIVWAEHLGLAHDAEITTPRSSGR